MAVVAMWFSLLDGRYLKDGTTANYAINLTSYMN